MRVTFPHMGNAYIPIRALLEGIGLDVVVPPPCSRKTMELGARYAPESVCFPLKLNLGNFIEALNQGADTILMGGGWGPCRFGYYAQVERDILRNLGYDFEIIILEALDDKTSEFTRQLKEIRSGTSWGQVLQAFRTAWAKLVALDTIESRFQYWMPRSIDTRRTIEVYEWSIKEIDKAGKKSELDRIIKESEAAWRNNEALDKEKPLKIGLVGEVYTLLEPFANYYIERKLGSLGAEVHRSVYLSHWVNDHLLGGVMPVGSSRKALKHAAPYVNSWVGGHGRETVGYSVMLARAGFDGIIQIGPLTCMPEIVAQTILERVRETEGIPVMTMYFDEHSGEAGIMTRLEAFLDMIRRREYAAGGRK